MIECVSGCVLTKCVLIGYVLMYVCGTVLVCYLG